MSEAVDHKWVMDNFRRFGLQWQIFRLLVKYDLGEGRKSDWEPAIDDKKNPVVFIPVEPKRPVI